MLGGCGNSSNWLCMLYILLKLYQKLPYYMNFVPAKGIHFLWQEFIFLWMQLLLCFVMPYTKFSVWRDWFFLPQEYQSTLTRNVSYHKNFCYVSGICFHVSTTCIWLTQMSSFDVKKYFCYMIFFLVQTEPLTWNRCPHGCPEIPHFSILILFRPSSFIIYPKGPPYEYSSS